MERESFESPEIAEVMNRGFVNVKVDREERPDVDKVYMTYVQVRLMLQIVKLLLPLSPPPLLCHTG
jgi:hypothetical protein